MGPAITSLDRRSHRGGLYDAPGTGQRVADPAGRLCAPAVFGGARAADPVAGEDRAIHPGHITLAVGGQSVGDLTPFYSVPPHVSAKTE